MTQRKLPVLISYAANWCRLLLLLVLVLANLRLPAADNRSGRNSAGEVLFNLTIRQPVICIHPGAELGLSLEIRNGTNRTISVLDRGTFYMTHFRQIILSDQEFETRMLDPVNDSMPGLEPDPQIVRLKPGESLRKNVAYKLSRDFFSQDGIYSMHLTYSAFGDKPTNLFKGALDSNEVLFQLSVCDTQ